MRILLADPLGMCFGVRDAITLAHSLEHPEDVTVYGELVHNDEVLATLRRRGLAVAPEDPHTGVRPIPHAGRVLVTAHGISDRERRRLEDAGKFLIDATCPLVRRAQRAARGLAADGWFVVVVGRAAHVEVRGMVEDLEDHAVVACEADVVTWNRPRIGIVCQTTTPPALAQRMVAAVSACNPHSQIRFVDTICGPTRTRQQAAVRLLDRVDALVVVGDAHSHNTLQLAALAETRGIPCARVRGPADVDPTWCVRYDTIGLTAGTSAPDATVAAVHHALLRVAACHEQERCPSA